MKKIIFAVMLLASTTAFADADPILTVMKSFNCLVCHSVNTKIVGPAFKDVATKYKGVPSAEDMLVKKISHGGSGVWGTVPMPPNDAKEERQADIRRLVQYVLRSAN